MFGQTGLGVARLTEVNMDIPVVIIIFRRAKITERVLKQIAKAKPRRLFVIADGPRPDRPEDIDECADTRAVIDRIDWDCEVYKNYSDVNMGVDHRIPTGLTWVFEQVDMAIILEDDCVPHPTFFQYCEELLERFRDDERVMHISGRSVFPEKPRAPYSYYFSSSMSWLGWATWARAWRHFDLDISLWPELRNTRWLWETWGDKRAVKFFSNLFEKHYVEKQPKSDLFWLLAVWSQNGLGIRPYSNLVYYAGYEDATNPDFSRREHFDFPTSAMQFPIRHPPSIARDTEADKFALDRFFADYKGVYYNIVGYPLYLKIYRKLRRHLSGIIPSRIRNLVDRS